MVPSARSIGLFVTFAALAAIFLPVSTYAVSLALFGVPHVVTELEYVDRRFSRRVSTRVLAMGAGLLVVLVAVRSSSILGGMGVSASGSVQAVLLAAFAALVLPPLLRAGGIRAVAGAMVFVAAAFGAWQAPLATLVVFAFLHNLSPVGFLLERFRGAERVRVGRFSVAVFLVAPSCVACLGASLASVPLLGRGDFDLAARFVGSLEQHRSAFVPSFVTGDVLGRALFQAAAFLQCLHHAVVLRVLPRLVGGGEPALLPWPSAPIASRALWIVSSVFAVAFLLAFSPTRAIYGVFAAVHAFVEVPVLCLALLPALPRVGAEPKIGGPWS